MGIDPSSCMKRTASVPLATDHLHSLAKVLFLRFSVLSLPLLFQSHSCLRKRERESLDYRSPTIRRDDQQAHFCMVLCPKKKECLRISELRRIGGNITKYHTRFVLPCPEAIVRDLYELEFGGGTVKPVEYRE